MRWRTACESRRRRPPAAIAEVTKYFRLEDPRLVANVLCVTRETVIRHGDRGPADGGDAHSAEAVRHASGS